MNETNPNSQGENEKPEDLDENVELEEEQAGFDEAAMEALNDAEAASAEEEVPLSTEEQQAAEIASLKEKLLRAMADTEN
ncbi:MAG: hypothetical protein MI743_10175, partial [Sneathiellales bacterium]|nr:hypothetical protein [Sneathiellales bacterium]